MVDKQLTAMQKVVEAFNALDETDLRVVLGFIHMRYGKPENVSQASGTAQGDNRKGVRLEELPSEYKSFPELYHAANPETEADKALVAGYWIQCVKGDEGFDSFGANSALKDMGYTVSNITRAFDSLMLQDPKYVIQVKKSGTSRQARKLYKLTHAGVKRVGEMLNSPDTGSDTTKQVAR